MPHPPLVGFPHIGLAYRKPRSRSYHSRLPKTPPTGPILVLPGSAKQKRWNTVASSTVCPRRPLP
eukprot:6339505-Amphidinium_carterae.1